MAARLALLLVSSALALGAIELFARATDPFGISYYKDTNRYLNEAILLPSDAGHEHGRLFENKAGADLALRTFDFRTDARGVRAAAVDQAAPPEKAKRILFLGDSVTLAWGVDDAESWIRTIEREARGPDGEALACLNAGHLQYNTTQEADWLATHGQPLAPDLVVLTFVVNDLDDAYALYLRFMDEIASAKPRSEWSMAEVAQASLPVWFRGTYALMNFWSERSQARTDEERSGERIEEEPGYAEAWARCALALSRIRDICTELGCDLIVLDHTTPRIPGVRPWCSAAGVPWFDFTFTAEEWARGVTNSPADAHANALGNRLLADKALQALRTAKHILGASNE